MENFDKFMETFVNGDYFLVFIAMLVIILVVLVLALIKTRQDYKMLLDEKDESEDIFDGLAELKAETKEDEIDEDKPLIKQIDIPSIKTYDDIIDEYENNEEENAVISSYELEQKMRERRDTLGDTDNQIAIAKYEEDQEKKAIISYEQLLRNAQNVTLSYKEEKHDKDYPRINRIEIEQKEMPGVSDYNNEEEFLKILKEFRITL